MAIQVVIEAGILKFFSSQAIQISVNQRDSALILTSFGVGLLVSGILLFPAWVRGRIELRRKTKALQEAEVDLERLRQALDKASRRAGPSDIVSVEGEQSHG